MSKFRGNQIPIVSIIACCSWHVVVACMLLVLSVINYL